MFAGWSMPAATLVQPAKALTGQEGDAMRAALLISVPALLATAGCAQVASTTDPHGLKTLANTSVLVNIDERYQVSVYPEPAPFIGDSNGAIKWALVLDPSDYIFPDDGIVFSSTAPHGKPLPAGCTDIGDPNVRFKACKPKNPERTEYQCAVTGNPHLSKSLCYFYVIKLVRVGGSGPAELVLDPWAKPK
jgi:hypothetical protein